MCVCACRASVGWGYFQAKYVEDPICRHRHSTSIQLCLGDVQGPGEDGPLGVAVLGDVAVQREVALAASVAHRGNEVQGWTPASLPRFGHTGIPRDAELGFIHAVYIHFPNAGGHDGTRPACSHCQCIQAVVRGAICEDLRQVVVQLLLQLPALLVRLATPTLLSKLGAFVTLGVLTLAPDFDFAFPVLPNSVEATP